MANKTSRTRNWTIIVYDDSAPTNWRDILDEIHIEWIESPLHDKDLNATGEPKKPHRHVLLMFGGVKSYEQVLPFSQMLNSPIPTMVHNSKALVRYMAHLDNPEKAQYEPKDIIGHGGVDLSEMLRPCSSERYTIIAEMITFVRDNNITEFQDLVDYAIHNQFDRWFPLLADNSAFILCNYIKSQRHRSARSTDFSTGEII